MFWSYNKAGTDAIGLMVGGGHNTPIAWFRVREVDEEWHSAASEEIGLERGRSPPHARNMGTERSQSVLGR